MFIWGPFEFEKFSGPPPYFWIPAAKTVKIEVTQLYPIWCLKKKTQKQNSIRIIWNERALVAAVVVVDTSNRAHKPTQQ